MYTAALQIASRQKPKGVAERTAAEFIVKARRTEMFNDAVVWMDFPPRQLSPMDQALVKHGCKKIVQYLTAGEAGYDSAHKTWWLPTGDQNDRSITVLSLMALGDVLENLWHTKATTFAYHEFMLFISLACGPDWQTRYRKFVRDTRKRMNNETRTSIMQGQADPQPA
jgi:hypothetical protein